ncbi:site-specific integrase [Pseudocitrobacter faecalis]|nr:site-specific integrase [Pseudocitrobacter faecalis]
MAEPTAFRWLCLQESLLKAPNTVEAYARGIDDWLRFCRQNDVSPTEASREILALYVRHLNTSRNLAAASLRHRLTIVRLYCDYLREEGLIVLNPVMRGSWHPGGGGRRGSFRHSDACHGYRVTVTGKTYLSRPARPQYVIVLCYLLRTTVPCAGKSCAPLLPAILTLLVAC